MPCLAAGDCPAGRCPIAERPTIFARDRVEPLLEGDALRMYREELEASESDPYGLQFQALLQTNSHKKRLAVFTSILETERKRLTARATLQSMFAKDE